MAVVLYLIHIVVAVFLIMVILLQQGKGSDLGAAFGGASQTLFGGASGRQSFLVKVTVALGVIFMLLSLGLSWRASHLQSRAIRAPGAPVAPGPQAPTGPSQESQGPQIPSAE